MNCEYPYLEKVKHLIFKQGTSHEFHGTAYPTVRSAARVQQRKWINSVNRAAEKNNSFFDRSSSRR
jgi:hypothetical protein